MASQVKPVPEGYTSVTPHMTVTDGNAAIEFYKKSFGAEEIMRMPGPDGKSLMHAELQIGDARIMLNDEYPMPGLPKAPATLTGTTFTMHLYVPDVDASFKRAVDAGAKGAMPPADMFWGDRYSKVIDPFGHHWGIATHIKDMTAEECAAAAAEWAKSKPECE
jgi:uncharacterized glyoxalase superfamily protein PhnB